MVANNEQSRRESEARSAVEAAKRFLGQGEPLLAYNAVQEGLEAAPGELRLRQLQRLTLARSGDIEQANRLLAQLATEGVQDSETLGMLARTHKDLAFGAVEGSRREFHLQAGFQLYYRAYESARQNGNAAGTYYPGIDAAT